MHDAWVQGLPAGTFIPSYPAYHDPSLTSVQYPNLIYGNSYPRLQSLKAQFDPNSVFKFPQYVVPLSNTSKFFLVSCMGNGNR